MTKETPSQRRARLDYAAAIELKMALDEANIAREKCAKRGLKVRENIWSAKRDLDVYRAMKSGRIIDVYPLQEKKP